MEETKVQEVDINDLVQDKRNFNKGNEQGQELMERSFKEMGAGRSILIDRNGHLTWDLRAPFTQGGGLRRGCGIAA